MGGCCGNAGEVMILACSGGSNVGQITNQAAVELSREGHGKMFCLAGIGAQLQGFVKSAQDTSRIAVLDGCARKIMESAQVSGWEYLVLTDMGIEKVRTGNWPSPLTRWSRQRTPCARCTLAPRAVPDAAHER